MGSSLVGIAFFVGILEVCFLYKVVWEEFMLRGEYAIYFSYKVVWGDVHTPRFSIICNYIIDYVSYNFSFC